MLASHGAKVVVNDLGGDRHGVDGDLTAAQKVVEEIKSFGGEAVVNGGNVADFMLQRDDRASGGYLWRYQHCDQQRWNPATECFFFERR